MQDQREPLPSARRSVWRIIGMALAVVGALVGLAYIGFFILIMVVMSSYGSNK
jgi:hypothetical protein